MKILPLLNKSDRPFPNKRDFQSDRAALRMQNRLLFKTVEPYFP
ncbi:hypothetical protein [Okeania sp. SIO2C9]|nr:hypothetical protein [Okeania sp. SIO2C9]